MIYLSFKYSVIITLLITSIFLFYGCIYSIIEKRNSLYIYSTFGPNGILFTGIIGTTVHEIGHLIMCLIFNHKINDFQLFNFRGYKYEETLGYVSHRYNDRNLYQKSGNFFIGIAPMISGTLFIIVIFKLLLPDIFENIRINEYLTSLSYINIENTIILLINLSKTLFLSLFDIHNFKNINFYIFVYLMFSVSSHISLSKKDFKNSYIGIFSLFLMIFIICLSSIIFNFNIKMLIMVFMKISIYLFSFLSIGLIFSLISLIISYSLSMLK